MGRFAKSFYHCSAGHSGWAVETRHTPMENDWTGAEECSGVLFLCCVFCWASWLLFVSVHSCGKDPGQRKMPGCCSMLSLVQFNSLSESLGQRKMPERLFACLGTFHDLISFHVDPLEI